MCPATAEAKSPANGSALACKIASGVRAVLFFWRCNPLFIHKIKTSYKLRTNRPYRTEKIGYTYAKNQRLFSSFDTTKENAKGTKDRSPQHPRSTRLHRWSAAFWTSKVVCQRQNHYRCKNQTEATCPRTRNRTPELIPPMTIVSGDDIRTAGFHPQTQHRIHHLLYVTYANKHMRVLLDNTSSLLHHDVGANAVVTGITYPNSLHTFIFLYIPLVALHAHTRLN
jgi:hypothetical protein